MMNFVLQPDGNKKFNYEPTEEELKLMNNKNFIYYAIDNRGFYICYRGEKRKITEQKERYMTLLEALGNMP